MLGTCTQCGHNITQVTDEDPVMDFQVSYLVCSNKVCSNADPGVLAEELFLEEADRQFELATNR